MRCRLRRGGESGAVGGTLPSPQASFQCNGVPIWSQRSTCPGGWPLSAALLGPRPGPAPVPGRLRTPASFLGENEALRDHFGSGVQPGPRPAARRAGLTAQRLLAARVARQRPGHGHEAGPAALPGQFPGITLHGRTPHRHGAHVAHAGLAVADPPLSRLQQTRSVSPRAQAQPQGGPRPPAPPPSSPATGTHAQPGAPHQP